MQKKYHTPLLATYITIVLAITQTTLLKKGRKQSYLSPILKYHTTTTKA